jgi:hypothetical protein
MPQNWIMDCCDLVGDLYRSNYLRGKEPPTEISQVMITYSIYSVITYHI